MQALRSVLFLFVLTHALQASAQMPPRAAEVGPKASSGRNVTGPIKRQNDAASDASPPARRQPAKFTFEFSKAEVQDIVKAISDMTKQNFIIPERIKGQRITILSPTQINAAEAYQVFHTALAANGIAVVRSGKFYKLVDSKEAIKDTVPTCIDGETGGACALNSDMMVTALMRMRFIDAAQVTSVAKSLLSKDGDIAVFQPSNALIVSEYSPNLKRVRKILDALDIPGFDDELRLIQVHYAAATEISEKLTQVFEVQNNQGRMNMGGMGMPNATRRGPNGGPGSGAALVQTQAADDADVQISKVVPDDRTNQIIIKANRRSFDAIKHLIARLDVPVSEGEQGRVHVYYLENAKAEDLSSTLASLVQGTPQTRSKPVTQGGPMGMPNMGMQNLAQKANDTGATTLFEGEVKITADKATNSLLVMSSARDYRAVRAIIEKLDMPRRQVYVEAAILEVNLSDDTQFGLNFHGPKQFKDGDLGPLPGAGALGFLQSAQTTAPGNVSPTFTALMDGKSLLSAAGGSLGGLLGGALQVSTGVNGEKVTVPSFGILLKWLTTTSNANILSTPHILTTDNEQAHIEVGEKIPFNSGIFGGGLGALSGLGGAGAAAGGLGALGGLGGLSSQVQRIDVSLKLTLTPQINERNKIRLEIEQTVEDVSGREERSQTPTTSKRAIKTVVVVDDQQTIVLGGLIKDSTTESESKVPVLGDIPLIGWLFKQHSTKLAKTNLLLILTPYIISSSEDFQRIFERKMHEQEEFAAEYYGHQKAFRAHVDYRKKIGPLGRIVSTLRREREKFENGGSGDGSSSVVGPQAPDTGHDASSRRDSVKDDDDAFPILHLRGPGPKMREEVAEEAPGTGPGGEAAPHLDAPMTPSLPEGLGSLPFDSRPDSGDARGN